MHITITNRATNIPPLHYMVVDGRGVMVDFSSLRNTPAAAQFLDPSVLSIDWQLRLVSGQFREAGVITRQDGTVQPFVDRALLKPFLRLFEAARFDSAHFQAETDIEIAETAALLATPAAPDVSVIDIGQTG